MGVRPVALVSGLLGLLGLVASAWPSAAPAELAVGRFERGLEPWREVRLGERIAPNRFRLRPWDGVMALEVVSQRSMSLMARPLDVDLQRLPVLCWRWRVDAPLKSADLTRRSGDDYAARVYVSLRIPDAHKSLALRAQLRLARAIWGDDVPDAALNYVWDNRHPVGTERPNAYTDRTRMIVQRSGPADAGGWVVERRDIRSDAARLFGPWAAPSQLALAADTDDTGEAATAGFAELHFVAADSPCRFGVPGPRGVPAPGP